MRPSTLRAFDDIDAAAADGHPYDVVHDHSGFTAFAFASRLATPLVHTLHGPFIGRMNDDRGPHRAIAAARRAGMRLLLAGPVQPGQEEFFEGEVEPHLDRKGIEYIGEIGEEKGELYAGAAALLMPIRWPEPFGLVMTEAMACGTPVIAFAEGSATEIVLDGETGFIVEDEEAMGEAAANVGSLDPHRCRDSAAERFDVGAVASAHERAYRKVIDRGHRSPAYK